MRKLMYPLNVYAYILDKKEGNADYLHFGLYQTNENTTPEAQKQSTALLMSLLPSPPAAILEVGTGLGTLFGQLRSKGYQVPGINPDANQVDIARDRLGKGIDIQICKFEDFETSKTYDLILLQEVSQYIPMDSLFSQSNTILTNGGQVLLMDEMKAAPAVESHLHATNHYLEAANASGFDLDLEEDLTDQARPTVDYLLISIDELHEGITRDLDISLEQLTELKEALKDYKSKYEDGSYLYKLYRFTRR